MQHADNNRGRQNGLGWALVLLFSLPGTVQATGMTPGLRGSGAVNTFTGSYQYSVDLDIPPGRAGMQPGIRLRYSSDQSGFSWVGHGWSLDLGTIERSGPRGAVASYDDETDEFYFGGERLVSVGPGEYRTERDQFLRIRLLADGSFEVTNPKGVVSVFGRSDNTRILGAREQVWRWLIEQSTDANGNTVTFEYMHDEFGAVYPAKILYTGGNGFSAQRSINFVTRRLKPMFGRTSYRSGRRIEWRRELVRVEAYVSDVMSRRYKLDYRIAKTKTRFLLAEVSQTDLRGQLSLPGYRFGYVGLADEDRAWRDARSPGWSVPPGVWLADLSSKGETTGRNGQLVGGTVDVQGFWLAELNGDGYLDMATNSKVYLNKGVCDPTSEQGCGWQPAPVGTWTIPQEFTHSHLELDGGQAYENNISSGTVLVDVNGDRRADIIHANGRTGVRQVYLNNGVNGWDKVSDCRRPYTDSGCTGPWVFPVDVVQTWPAHFHKTVGYGVRLGNLNGDDYVDIMVAHDGDRRTYLGNGSGWTQVQTWTLPEADPPLDFVISGSTPNGWSAQVSGPNFFYQGVKLIDVNGDGLDDLVINSPNYDGEASDGFDGINPDVPLLSWPKATYLNDGAGGFTLASEWVSPLALTDYPVQRFGNYNGDELPDFAYYFGYTEASRNSSDLRYGAFNYGSEWVRLIGTDDFFDLPVPTYVAKWGTFEGGGNGTNIGDIDGDGWADVVHARRDDSNDAPGIWLHTSRGQAIDAMATAMPPHGGVTKIAYRPTTRFDNPNLPLVRYVTHSVIRDPGLGQPVHETFYSYEGGRLDEVDHRFAGFAQAVATDEQGAVATSYHQTPALRGRVMATSFVDVKSSKKLLENHRLYGPDEDEKAPYRIPFSGRATTLWNGDKQGRSTAEVTWFDDFGNAVERFHLGEIPSLDSFLSINSSDGLPENGDERTEVATFKPDTNAWIVALPASHSTYTGLGVSQQTRVAGTHYVYDEAGNLRSEDRWLENVGFFRMLTQTPDDSGNIVRRTDALNRTTRFNFDQVYQTFVTRQFNPLHQVRRWVVDVLTGLVLSETDENGNQTSYHYDGFGRLLQRQDPMGTEVCPSETFTYLDQENMMRRRVGGPCIGVWDEILYDGFGRAVQTRSSHPEGRTVVSTEYDARGQISQVSVPFVSDKSDTAFDPGAKHWTTTARDAASRLVRVTHPDGRYRTITYSADGSQVTTDESNVEKQEPTVRTRLTDAYGNLVKVTEPDGNGGTAVTTYEHDALGRIRSITDAQDNVTSVVWDSLGRRTSIDDPDLGPRTFAYDLVGNLLLQTDAQGARIRHKYDALDRRVRIDLGDDDTDDYRFGFDGSSAHGVGHRTGMTDLTGDSGESIFAYDALGRIIREEKTLDGMSFVTQWRYDKAGRLAEIKWPDGERTLHNYDISGALLSVNACIQDRRYNAAGQIVHQEFTNGAVESYTYDEHSGRLQEKMVETPDSETPDSQMLIYSFGLEFDDVGNILKMTDHLDAARTQTFTYDSLYRLKTASAETYGFLEYAYDSIGNMTKMQGRTFTYPPSGPDSKRPHAVISDGNATYKYDDNGNMISGAGRTISYNLEDRPVEVTKDGNTVHYVYDGDGVRVKKIVVGGDTTLYIGQFRVVK